MSSKTCEECGLTKELSEFYFSRSNLDGRMGRCKSCVRVGGRKNRREPAEQYARYERSRASLPHRVGARRKYQEEHKVQIAQYKKIWTASNKESVGASKRSYYEREREDILALARSGQRITPKKSGKPRPTIFAKGGLRGTPVVGTLPFRSSKNSATVTATNVWLAAIPKPYLRLTMSCL